ncbi:N-6 DNA methylase [Niveispirillum sp.]|uniref:N-6 DNA methylase n=1 Tax=Niveispirillum sp. TaxID=1917217 RepID=UPI001B5DC69D|nr:N-6 DNA methylase [Niveispirillum sp.]MBP7339947.1 N-6 DNA methylase [Niveispirillum sp.]
MTDAIDDYLLALHRTRASGGSVRERGHYGALQNLLNNLGATLKPKVHCISELANAGAGSPDFGLFTAPQLVFDTNEGVRAIRPPDRGVVEAKSPDTAIERVEASEQVTQYWERYRLVLVTNFRSFLVVGEDEVGRRKTRERFDLAPDESSFWSLAAAPSRLPADIRLRFREFLHRLLLQNATLTQPRDVALILASLARDCRARLEAAAAEDKARSRQPNLLEPGGRASPLIDRLDDVRETLESALGIRFDTERGMHFFWSTLVQTLFYGIFSGWVIWARQPVPRDKRGTFSPLRVAWMLRLRVIRALFEQVYRPGALEGLGIGDVLDWACDVLHRVDDTAFFSRFREDHAVQYFYEPFLEAYDPDLRRELGVWYTPPEVVDYMVARVDWALRSQLGIERGLADPRVHVLDPCCGTGSFFLAILDRIHKTLLAEGEGDLAGSMVKRAAIERIHGFEIMPAPLVVAHLQVALALEHLYRAPLNVSDGHSNRPDEFPSILLTNALTGLDERSGISPRLPLPELEDDGYFAGRVKREEQIWVVIGNPPYNGFAGVDVTPEEKSLTDPWRQVRAVRPPEGRGLNDPYARFWRMAERRIAERTGFGVVCLITN